MNYHYLSFILLPFASLTAMEQGALLVQKPVLKTALSLKEIALKAYAKILHENAPKEALSEPQIADWGTQQGLSCFFDLNCGDLMPRLKQMLAEPIIETLPCCTKTNVRCPEALSADGRCELLYDAEAKKFVVRIDSQGDENLTVLIDEPINPFRSYCGLKPIFSEDGEWLLAWEKEAKLSDSKRLMLIQCASGKNSCTVFKEAFPNPYQLDCAFLNANTLIFCEASKIFVALVADFFVKGKATLKEVYQRSDGKEYKGSLWYRTIYALSNSYIACVCPDAINIEIFDSSIEGMISLSTIIPISDSKIIKCHVHKSGRAVLRVRCDPHTYIYKLLGAHTGKRSVIKLPKSPQRCLFSPSGQYLVYDTLDSNQTIEIFDCKNLDSPQHILSISGFLSPVTALEGVRPRCVSYLNHGIVVHGEHDEKYTIAFNNAAPLVARYAAYRKKLEEKEKATNKNAS